MFDRVLDLLLQVWSYLLPFEVVEPYQSAGVIRLGKYHRTVGPGLCWKIPFAESVNTQNSSMTTERLPPQTVTTKDRKAIVVQAIVKFRIRDVKPYISDVTDQGDVLIDVTMGAIRTAISAQTYEEAIENPPVRAVLEQVRKEVNKYGFSIESVTFTDLAKVTSIRLIQSLPKDLVN